MNRLNYNKSLKYIEKAVSLAPNDADILREAGLRCIFDDRPEKSLEYLNKSRMLDPLNRSVRIMGGAYFVLGRYEEAAKFFENSITNVPDILDMTPFIAATYAFLGRDDEAKKALEKWISLYADPYVARSQIMYSQYRFKNEEVFNRLMEGLVKAGWHNTQGGLQDPTAFPYLPSIDPTFRGVYEKNKLNGQEIKELLFGKTQTGYGYGGQWILHRTGDGIIELSNPYFGSRDYRLRRDKGKSWIEGDSICDQFEESYDGLKFCGDVYLNPEGDDITKSKYIYVADLGLFPFSVE